MAQPQLKTNIAPHTQPLQPAAPTLPVLPELPVVHIFITSSYTLQSVVQPHHAAPAAEKNALLHLPRFLRLRAQSQLVPAQRRLDALMCGLLLSRVCGVSTKGQTIFTRDRLKATTLFATPTFNWSAVAPTSTSATKLHPASFLRAATLSALAVAPQLPATSSALGLGFAQVGSVTAAQARQSLTTGRYLFAEDGWEISGEVALRRAFERAALIARLSAHNLCEASRWKSAEVPSNLQVSCGMAGQTMFCIAAPGPVRLSIWNFACGLGEPPQQCCESISID